MLASLIKTAWQKARGAGREHDDWSSLPFYDSAALHGAITDKARLLLSQGYLDYPRLVHLETLAVCNAACEFCPYPKLERQGTRMSDALIEKIIGDLGAIPPHVPFVVAPYKVSDPFLEPRLFDIMALVVERLPGAEIGLITNGSALTDRKLDQLAQAKSVSFLTVSLNFDNADEYEGVMKLSFARTLSRLEALNRRKAQGELGFPVRLTRVGADKASDHRFIHFARERFPALQPVIVPRNDWLGEVVTEGTRDEVPDVPCHRWFDLSITATGVVAMCCMDGEAKYPKGDVNAQHALEIYNHPRLRELRRSLISRRGAASPCSRCTYLSY